MAEIFNWSMEAAAVARAPERGFYGESFPAKSYRACLAGQSLAGGYKWPGLPLMKL